MILHINLNNAKKLEKLWPKENFGIWQKSVIILWWHQQFDYPNVKIDNAVETILSISLIAIKLYHISYNILLKDGWDTLPTPSELLRIFSETILILNGKIFTIRLWYNFLNISILFKIDDCASNPCFLGVHCTDMVASFSCGPCPSGYTGNGETCTRLDGSMYYIFWK